MRKNTEICKESRTENKTTICDGTNNFTLSIIKHKNNISFDSLSYFETPRLDIKVTTSVLTV